MPYQLLADAVLVLHFGVVVFVVGGLIAILVGIGLHWRWVIRWWFRLLHLAAIAFIVLQSWLGQLCPLTTLESWLRIHSGSPAYVKSFIQEWLQRLIFFQAPEWLFTLAYTIFGGLVLLAWWLFPPRPGRGDSPRR